MNISDQSSPSPALRLLSKAKQALLGRAHTGYALNLTSDAKMSPTATRTTTASALEGFADLMDRAIAHVAQNPDARIQVNSLEWRLHFDDRDGHEAYVGISRWGDMALLQMGADGSWIDLNDAEHIGVDVPRHTEIGRLPAWAARLRQLARIVNDRRAPDLLDDCRLQLTRLSPIAAALAGTMGRDKAVLAAASRPNRRATCDLEQRSDGIDMTAEFDRAGETWIPGFSVNLGRRKERGRYDLSVRPFDMRFDPITDPVDIMRILSRDHDHG